MSSIHYEKVKSYYDRNLWGLSRLQRAVACRWITASEYEDITGEPFVE